jgi:hypothetical protein
MARLLLVGGGNVPTIGADATKAEAPMSDRNRLKFKFPFFGEGEAEGLYGIAALVLMVVFVVAIAMYH